MDSGFYLENSQRVPVDVLVTRLLEEPNGLSPGLRLRPERSQRNLYRRKKINKLGQF